MLAPGPNIERIGNLAVVECAGVITQHEASCKLRNAVTSLEGVQVIVLDLSDVLMVEHTGLSTLLFLQQWTYWHRIKLKLFNPRWWVREKLEHASPVPGFDISSLQEIMVILSDAEARLSLAA